MMSLYEIKLALQRPKAFLDNSSLALQKKTRYRSATAEFLEQHFQHAPHREPWLLKLTVENTTNEERQKLQAAISRMMQYSIEHDYRNE
jgi:hypothetical protein